MGDSEQGAEYLDRLMDVVRAAAPESVASYQISWVIPAVARISCRFDIAETPQKQVLQDFSVRGSSISPDRVLGLLAQTMGNLDQAISHFEDGLAFCRKAGYRPELAWTYCDYADMLLERHGDGDRARAITMLDESLAISSVLGVRPLMERVLSRRELFGA